MEGLLLGELLDNPSGVPWSGRMQGSKDGCPFFAYRYTGADLFPIKGNAVKPVTADPNKTEFILLVFAPLKILTPSDRLLSVKKLKS